MTTPIPWLCCPWAILPQLWKYAWVHNPFEDQFATSWLMSWDVASTYSHTFPTSWCHLFCEVHHSFLQQSTPTTWCCHPCASWLGWCSSACKPPPFSSNIIMVIMAKQFYFWFIRPEDKKYDLCPHVQLKTVVCLFFWQFWSSGFFLAERPFRLCRHRTCFTVDIDTFAVVQGFNPRLLDIWAAVTH